MSNDGTYVVDTHAWVRYLLDKLPPKVNGIFLQAESANVTILIPTIALAECVYLVETGRISLSLQDLFSKLRRAENFIPVALTFEIVERLPNIPLTEIHDRVIVATAQLLNAKLITKDREIANSDLVQVVWS